MYIAIAHLKMASVSQVSKVSKVRREDVYRIMPKLEKMGLIERILGKPTKIRATPVKDALSILIKREQDIAKERLSALEAKKDEFLKHFRTYKMKPTYEEAHFALISEREAIINKELTMVKNADKAIDVTTSKDKFLHILSNYVEPFKEAIRRGVKVRMILDIAEHEDSILRIIEEHNPFKASLNLKYTDHPLNHCIIMDYKEAFAATSTEPTIGKNPYLWTDDNNLVGLFQKNFESIWHASVDPKALETEGVAEKLAHFLKDLRPTNHVIFLYKSSEAKYNVLFNYLKFGLENGEAVAYIVSEEEPAEIRDAMKRFGIEVEKYEKTGALCILRYDDFYIRGGKFNVSTTIGLIKKVYDEALSKGFKGLRGVGEMACFFENNLIQKLIEYEKALHRVLDTPVITVCAYNTNMLIKASNPMDLYNELLKAHSKVLFTGIDNRLGKIEIRQA